MTPQNTPLEISEEAFNVSREMLTYHGVPNEASARIVQNAINSATAKLREENESLQKQIVGLSGAAEMLWTVIANVSEGNWDKQSKDWQDAACRWRDNYFSSVKTTNFSHLYVRREVLEKCRATLQEFLDYSNGGCNPNLEDVYREQAKEVLTLARKELGA